MARSQNILKITKKLFVMFAKHMIQYDQIAAVAMKFRNIGDFNMLVQTSVDID